MKKSFLKVVTAFAAFGLSAGTMSAADAITGYFRVQSATGTADGTAIVQVAGPMTTAPNVTLEKAVTDAGTVMRLRAFPETIDGKLRYKIGNLSCQGIEVFGAPQTDIDGAMNDILADLNTGDYETLAYSLASKAGSMGYISTGRLIIEALFTIVADRLDSEIGHLSAEEKEALGIDGNQESLREFATRFNTEVSEKLDLNAYLEPTGNGTYRLYFHWIDCAPVSEFYLANERNKKSFEIGFACMRSYMDGKDGLASGEHIDLAEAALWKSWGYDITEKYADTFHPETQSYDLTYEMIFADHEVLYNWLKMYIERFLDPAKAPDASIMGINVKDFATEMQKHELMKGFLAYIPTIQENQKLYLTNGRFSDGTHAFSTVGTTSDNSSHFGLLAESQALAAGTAAEWNLLPISETSETNYFAIAPGSWVENGTENCLMSAVYYDFPIAAVEGTDMKFHTLNANTLRVANLENLGSIEYIELESEVADVARHTTALVELTTDAPSENKVRIVWEAQGGDYDPETSTTTTPTLSVGDDVIGTQHAPAASVTSASAGVLLATPATSARLNEYCGIDGNFESVKSAYVLGSKTYDNLEGTTISTPWFNEAATIPANSAIIVADKDKTLDAISLGEPIDGTNVSTGIDGIETVRPSDNVLYDLQGRRAVAPRAGEIYILNGRKILVR